MKRMIPEADITLLPGRRLSYGLNKLDTTPPGRDRVSTRVDDGERSDKVYSILQRIYQENISG